MNTNSLIIATIVVVLLATWGTHYLLSQKLSDENLKKVVKEAVLEVEYQKVWGKETFDKITEIQKKQIAEWLKQYEAQNGKIKTQPSQQPSNNQAQANQNNGNTLSQDQIKKVKEWVYILWNPDAEISFIEYSDLECPFCRKLHQAWTIDQILKEYGGKVNFIFKHFPLYFHPQAQMEAEAAECVAELGWKDKYYEFITKTFNNTQSNGRSFTVDTIADLAWTIWVDKAKVKECIKSWKYTSKVKNQEQEWANVFKVTWTPGNVILNNKTGKWTILPGAYPYAAFKQKIDNLLSK